MLRNNPVSRIGAMRRALKIGAALGFSVGVVIFAGYALASWWVCSSSRICPDHWLPYLVVFMIGVTVFLLLGMVGAAMFRGMYEVTRVDGTSDRDAN